MKIKHRLFVFPLALLLLISSIESIQSEEVEIVQNDNGYIMRELSSYYVVVGELINKGNSAITDLEISANFYDENNNLIAIRSNTLTRAILTPFTLQSGYKIPFNVQLEGEDSARLVSKYTLFFTYSYGIEKNPTLFIINSSLEKIQTNEIFMYNEWEISGEIFNNGTISADNTKVLASLFDKSNQTIGFAGLSFSDQQPGLVSPGESSFFSITTRIPIDKEVVTFNLYAESDNSVIQSKPLDGVTPEEPTDKERITITSTTTKTSNLTITQTSTVTSATTLTSTQISTITIPKVLNSTKTETTTIRSRITSTSFSTISSIITIISTTSLTNASTEIITILDTITSIEEKTSPETWGYAALGVGIIIAAIITFIIRKK